MPDKPIVRIRIEVPPEVEVHVIQDPPMRLIPAEDSKMKETDWLASVICEYVPEQQK